MTTEQMKKGIESIVKESARRMKEDFVKLPEEVDALEALQQVLQSHMGDETILRLQRTASQYGIPDKGTQGFRAYLNGVQVPCEKKKPITVKLEVENTHESRIALANIDMAAVNVYGSQLEIDTEAEEEDDGQEELDLGGEEQEGGES